jgi:carboxymethylenebutenolidase
VPIVASVEKIRVDDSDMDVHLGVPSRETPGPAVVLMYHRGGIDDFTKGVVDRLVSHGYLAAVPDIYHRCPSAMPAIERKSLLKDSEILADVQATVEHLRARSSVDADRIVIMGHCMGGRMALLAAGNLPGFCGTVVYYGGSVARSWGEGATPFERLRRIQSPVIGFFGDDDRHPSPEDVDRIDAELSRHGIVHEFHRYPGVGHGFQNPAHDTPQERAAAEDAWAKTFSFLNRVASSDEL